MDSLKPPTFDWNSSEQFEDFQLFIKGMEGWYTLQGIPDKDGDTTRRVSAQFLGSHQMKEARAVEPLWCNCRGTREE